MTNPKNAAPERMKKRYRVIYEMRGFEGEHEFTSTPEQSEDAAYALVREDFDYAIDMKIEEIEEEDSTHE